MVGLLERLMELYGSSRRPLDGVGSALEPLDVYRGVSVIVQTSGWGCSRGKSAAGSPA